MSKPQVMLDPNVHTALKQYCALKGKKLSHIASKVLGEFLETEHEQIESEGEMVIEGEKGKPKTIVEILKGDE